MRWIPEGNGYSLCSDDGRTLGRIDICPPGDLDNIKSLRPDTGLNYRHYKRELVEEAGKLNLMDLIDGQDFDGAVYPNGGSASSIGRFKDLSQAMQAIEHYWEKWNRGV